MYKKFTRGFTLIELLVVIAIIGILAGIVLASLGTARGGANDAKTKEQLSNLRTAMEQYYATNGSYGTAATACTGVVGSAFVDGGVAPLVATANYQGALTCHSTASVWAVSAPLNTAGQFWCVDSTGASKNEAAALGVGINACP